MTKYILIGILVLAATLRLVGLGTNPPSLYWDEVSLGYNAYSILKTGKDEHGNSFPQVTFPAFGDYKPPGYIYAAVPSIAVFGLNEFAVRFPSAIAGFFAVFLTYLLALRLFRRADVALVAALLLALSPWHINLSRAAFEANLATTFVLAAVYWFVRGVQGSGVWFVLAALFAAFSMHTFNAHRLFTPLLFMGFGFLFLKQLWERRALIVVSLLIAGLFLFPLVQHLRSDEGQLRFQEVSIFTDLEPIKQSNEWIEKDSNVWWANIIHNRRVLFAFQFFQHYLHHWNGMYLFVTGDMNPRFSVQTVGQLYLVELPFLILGWFWLFRKKENARWILLWWFLIAPIPAAMARETPHALRTMMILPTFQLVTAYGWLSMLNGIKRESSRRWLIAASAMLFAVSVGIYLWTYWVTYPVQYAGVWQYGYKQAIERVRPIMDDYDEIVMTTVYGRPYIYWLFYLHYPPGVFQTDRGRIFQDQYGFYHVGGFDKLTFRDIAWEHEVLDGKKLFIAFPGHIPANVPRLFTIDGPNGERIFDVVEG
ncbi:MAG: glycosyltransferase family 39 protein [bacterium]|nr:glycosyltransferase family 39 protein [bacterium]